MAAKTVQQNDALLALISTLSVVFIVLFISLAYFLNFRTVVARQSIEADVLYRDMVAQNNAVAPPGDVAGYEFESPVVEEASGLFEE